VLRPEPGARCLDLPCGDGALTAALARAVGVGGGVLALDSDTGAVASCAEEAASLGLGNVEVALAHEREATPGAFDIAGSLLTLPHRADPAATLATCASALRPGGRLAVAVWAAPGAVPPLDHALATFEAVTGARPPALETALSLGAPGALETLAAAAGLQGTRVTRLREVVRFHGVDHLVAALAAAYALEAEIEALDDAALAAVLEMLSVRLLPFTAWDGTLVVPVQAVVLSQTG
jgi:SAM-dependent methyltransferase